MNKSTHKVFEALQRLAHEGKGWPKNHLYRFADVLQKKSQYKLRIESLIRDEKQLEASGQNVGHGIGLERIWT